MAIVININARDGATPQLKKVVKEIGKLNKGSRKASIGLKQFAGAFVGLQAAQAVKRALISTIQVFRKFEFTISKIRAVSGASEKQLRSLKTEIKELGRTTIFTASQVGEAALKLSKLGFGADQVKDALPGVVSLAAASGEELAESAETMAATLRAFQRPAQDAGKVSDLMAKAFSSSSLNLLRFSESMRSVAPVASGLGISLTETTALLASLTDKGFAASTAGTSLRFALIDLATPTSKISKALGGATLQTKTFTELLDLMKEKGLTSTQVMELLGKKGGIGLAALLQTGTESIEKMTATMEDNAGAAKRMADIMTDNLEGAIKRLESATEGFQIESGKAFTPLLLFWLQGATDLMSQLTGKFEDSAVPLDEIGKKLKFQNELIEEQIKQIKISRGLGQSFSRILNKNLDEEIFRRSKVIVLTKRQINLTIAASLAQQKARALSLQKLTRVPKLAGFEAFLLEIEEAEKKGGKPTPTPPAPGVTGGPKDTGFELFKENQEAKIRILEQIADEEQQLNLLRIENITENFERERATVQFQADEKLALIKGNAELEIEIEKEKERKLTEINQKESDSRKAIKLAELNAIQQIGNNFISAAENLLSIDKQNAGILKALAVERVIFSTSIGVAKALEGGPFGIAAAIFIGALGLSQIAKIEATTFKHGGVVPGSGVGDTVPALLEPSERVVSNREISGIGGIGQLEDFLRESTAGGSSRAVLTVREGGGAMGELVRQMLPFIDIEMQRA